MNPVIVALDLGGTWLKGIAARVVNNLCEPLSAPQRIPNPLASTSSAEKFADEVAAFCQELAQGNAISIVTGATAGEVDAAGKNYICAGEHLGVMGKEPWVEILAQKLQCPINLLNDAETFLLGASTRGLVPPDQNVGALVIGTGLGFAVSRMGRWWKPARRSLHFGAMTTESSDYNQLVSAVRAAECGVFNSPSEFRDIYIDALTNVTASAVHLFYLNTVVFGGGAVDAAKAAEFDLAQAVRQRLSERLLPGFSAPKIYAAENGNQILLEGALALGMGNLVAEEARFASNFQNLSTERRSEGPTIDTFSPQEITRHILLEESKAAQRLVSQSEKLSQGATILADALHTGGRVIYLGAGTSGRIGALDAVEIPCTFGMSPDRFVAVIAGGVADAALTIEDQFEEDTSSVGDLILLGLNPNDAVVGISASGTAYFVRSGLAYARSVGAKTIFIHEATVAEDDLADLYIRMESGTEVIAGSTRMKAGTATKKILNSLSTTTMILLGKVRQGEMIDLHCCNAKLRERAARILARQTDLSLEAAEELLSANGYHLKAALDAARQ